MSASGEVADCLSLGFMCRAWLEGVLEVILDIITVILIYWFLRPIARWIRRNLTSSKTESSDVKPSKADPRKSKRSNATSSDSRFNDTNTSDDESNNLTLAIQQGFQSELYPFLESKAPTDTLDHTHGISNDLSQSEREFLAWKRVWLNSPYPAQLAEIVARVIENRKESPILNVVCLGIGSMGWGHRDYHQLVMLSQVIAQLAVANPAILNNLVAQDPHMGPEMRQLLENHGFQVVEDPAAFRLVGSTTLVFSGWVALETLLDGLKDQPVKDVPMFIGNTDLTSDADITESRYKPQEQTRTLSRLLDRILCNHQDVPCPEEGDEIRLMDGLREMRIWWKPVRGEIEKIEVRFDAARKLGFPNDFGDFSAAYAAGFGDLSNAKQDIAIYIFMAATFNSSTQSFEAFFQSYENGLSDDQEKYKLEMWRYLSILLDEDCRCRSWLQYLEG